MIEADRLEIAPAVRIRGAVSVPGDKAISHRLAMIGAIAQGQTVIHNFAESADCQSTLECLRRLGISIEREGARVSVEGRGLQGLQAPRQELDAGNSGTTVRMMAGILAGFPFESTFVGDESLSRRPMKRIMEPLRRFGAKLEARDDNYLPLKVTGGALSPITFTMPVASAQVKSAVLFAGLHARGTTIVNEPMASRNHTEIAVAEFGAKIKTASNSIQIEGGHALHGKQFTVPGDISSAAFLIAAALAVPGSRLRITGVGLNPTRTGFLNLLQEMQANVRTGGVSATSGEPAGHIDVEYSEISGMDVGDPWIPSAIDEIPVLAVLGARTRNGIRIRDASELRAKESDRIHAVVVNLRALGGRVEEYPDGLFVPGQQSLHGGEVDSFGDHRIAMAFAVAGLFAKGTVSIKNPSCVGISFPGFFDLLKQVCGT